MNVDISETSMVYVSLKISAVSVDDHIHTFIIKLIVSCPLTLIEWFWKGLMVVAYTFDYFRFESHKCLI